MDRSLDTGRVNRRKFYGTVIHHAAAGTVRAHPVAVIGTALGALLVAGPCSTPSSSTSLGTALRPAVLVAAVTAVAHVEDRLAQAAPNLEDDVVSPAATNWTPARFSGRRVESVR
jgi:hypothetical protein